VEFAFRDAPSGMGRWWLVSTCGEFPGLHAAADILSSCWSLVVITLLFTVIFKIVPDVNVAWQDVWMGATITVATFIVRRHPMALCLAYTVPAPPTAPPDRSFSSCCCGSTTLLSYSSAGWRSQAEEPGLWQ